LDQKYLKMAILLLVLLCIEGIAGAEPSGKYSVNSVDCTEGGHYDTDFGANFMSEWWYQNGDMRLVGEDGEKRNLAFFVVMAHQESPTLFTDPDTGAQFSNMATFYGLYPYGENASHNYTMVFVPREEIKNYIGFHVPYLDFTYPEDLRHFYSSGSKGYKLDYAYDNMQVNLDFKPLAEETIDSATEPVNFTTYERSYGNLKGSVTLDGKKYTVTQADGYFDHMIPYTTDQPTWEMEMQGWSWSELTTDNYQTIFYGIRGVNDGYDKYSYKQLTLLDKHIGQVIKKYTGNDVHVLEKNWVNVEINGTSTKRPSRLEITTSDLNISINSQSVVQLDKSSQPGGQPVGFVDFMAFQPDEATIEYKGNLEQGSAFYEYMVSDWSIFTSSQ